MKQRLRWREPCSTSRTSSFWTSPPPGSIPKWHSKFAGSSRNCRRREGPSCSAHLLGEAESLCHRISLRTRLLAVGSPTELRQQLFRRTTTIELAGTGPLPRRWPPVCVPCLGWSQLRLAEGYSPWNCRIPISTAPRWCRPSSTPVAVFDPLSRKALLEDVPQPGTRGRVRRQDVNRRRLRVIIIKEWAVLSRDVNSILLYASSPAHHRGGRGGHGWCSTSPAMPSLNRLSSRAHWPSCEPPSPPWPTWTQLTKSGCSSSPAQPLPPLGSQPWWRTVSPPLPDEKLSGSLEALLATPIRTGELLLGKALAGAIPALAASWICAGMTLLVVSLMGWRDLVAMVVTPAWVLTLVLLVPGVTLLSFLLGVIGSSRARDPKNAQNLVVVIILPVFGLIALQISGVLWLGLVGTLALACGV